MQDKYYSSKGLEIRRGMYYEDCIGCGLCESTAPEVFEIGEDGLAHAIEEEVPEAAEDAAQEACDGCPVTAIELD